MTWPWVLRSRLDTVKQSHEILREIIDKQDVEIVKLEEKLEQANADRKARGTQAATDWQALEDLTRRYDKLVDKMMEMKQQGFVSIPPKIAPQAGTAEDGYMKRELAAQKGPDPFIEGLLAEGRTLEEAQAIRKQAQQDFKAGEM